MSDQEVGLNIKITADVANALRNFTQLSDATGELLVEGKGNITSINLALKDLREAVKTAGNPTELGILNRAIKDLSSEAARLGRAGTEGFDELGNKVKKAEQATNGLTGGLGKAFSGLRNIANILPGVGIAGIVGLLASGLGEATGFMELFGDIIGKTTDKEKLLERQTKDLKSALDALRSPQEIVLNARGSQEGEIDRVRALAKAVQDSNLSYKQRQNALLELRQINKEYFGDLKLEENSLASLTQRVKDYSNALYQQAIVKGLQDNISKVSTALYEQEQALIPLQTKYDDAQGSLDRFSKELGNNGQAMAAAGSALGPLVNNASKAKNAFDAQREAVFKLRENLALLRGQLQNSTIDQISTAPLKVTADKKGIDELEKEIQALEQAKSALQALFKSGERPGYEIQRQLDEVNTKLLQDKIEKALRDGAKNGLSKEIIALQVNALQQELDKIGQIKPTRIRFDLQPIKNVDSMIEKAFGAPGETPVVKFNAKIQAIIDYYDYFQTIKKDISKQLADLAGDGIAGIAAGIGKAISGAGNPFDGFLKLLGDGLERIGKYLISVSPLILALQTALKNLGTVNPAVLLLAGVGLVAVGAAIKSNIKATPFAEGGIVTGPTYSLIGEAGPEAVFPLDKLNNFIGGIKNNGSNVNVSGQFKISGNDLILVAQRANKQRGLVQ